METFLLNFVNAFKAKWFTHAYKECTEVRCGVFQFDNFRVLPYAIVTALNLSEIAEFDDEANCWIYSYTTNFAQ